MPELIAQIRKSKAIDWLLHHVEMVDPDGKPIDRDLVLGHTHDDTITTTTTTHDHDHDHDHDDTITTTTTDDHRRTERTDR